MRHETNIGKTWNEETHHVKNWLRAAALVSVIS